MTPTLRFAVLCWCLVLLLPGSGRAAEDSLEDRIAAACSEAGIPGSVILLQGADGDQRIIPCGVSDLATGEPVQADSLFRIGSITKTFMAVLALKLAGEGYFTLDDPITDYLPEAQSMFGRITDPTQITVRDLLQHSSGLPDYVEILAELPPILQQALSEHDWRQTELPEIIHGLPASFPPGEGMSYTNTGYVLLGLLLERTSGQGLASLLHEYIFDPLGLDNTYYAATEETPPQTRCYLLDDLGYNDVTRLDMPEVAAAAGCILTDAADLAAFSRALFQGELLSAEQWLAMSAWRPLSERTDYGLGLMKRTYKGHLYYGHGGETLGYRAAMYWFPDDELLVIGFANLGYSDVETALYLAIDEELGLE